MDKRGRRQVALSGVCLMLVLGLVVVAATGRCAAATVKRAWIEHRGAVYSIHLQMTGRPRWVLSQQANRLQIDLLNANSNLGSRQYLQAGLGPLGSVRISAAEGQRMRVQIDSSAKCDYVVGRRSGQLIVSLAPAGADANLADALTPVRRAAPARVRPPPQPAIAKRTQVAPQISNAQVANAAASREVVAPPAASVTAAPAAASFAAQPGSQARPIVVVDAGHGGYDPGTRSEDGVLEKDLALAIARRLADALKGRGVNAVLTRDRDEFLSLAQRTAIANQLSAELFVSIHLNWSPNPQTEGIEVYYLNNTTNRATIRLARMENAASGGQAPLDPGLNYILSDLRQQYKATESALLAQVMEQQTVSDLQTAFGDEIRGLGAKRGPFYVLVGPRIPAVLVECGFLSNSSEAGRLASAAYQQALADGLATSVVHYLNQDVTAGTL